MVTIRKSAVSRVIPVETEARLQKKKNRKAFLNKTDGKVWDEETSQFLTSDEYMELAGDSVIAENEYWDNLSDEEHNQVMKDLNNE